jgi:hypothetical protein
MPMGMPPAPVQVDDDDEPVDVPMPTTPPPNESVVGAFPGSEGPTAPPGDQQGQQPVLMPRPGMVAPNPNTPQPQPLNQPSVVRPVGPGGGGPGGN